MAQPVRLKNKAAFRAALRDYRMSPHAEAVLRESRLVILSGVAAGGRNSVIRYLVEHYDYMFMVSDTTRPPKLRDGVMEQDGVQYYFRKEDDMLRDIQAGEFIEAEIIHNQQVSGTSVRELERANKTHRIVINELEIGGTQAIARAKPDAAILGLLPPDYDEWIRRFRSREDISDEEFINRLETAKRVLEQLLTASYFSLVINRNIAECARDIHIIVDKGIVDPVLQQEARLVAESLLEKVKLHLA